MDNFILEANKLSDVLTEVNSGNVNKLLSAVKEQCLSKNPSLAASAIHVLVKLVEQNILNVPQGLSTLISLISSSKETIPILVPAVSRLLLLDASSGQKTSLYNLNDRPHPFLIFLKNDWNIWIHVSAFITDLCIYSSSKMSVDKRIEIVWPILSHVILDPQAPVMAKSQVIQLLLASKQEERLFQLLAWQQIDLNWCFLIREIVGKYLESNRGCSSPGLECLTPCLAAAVVYLISHGHDPSCWLSLLTKSLPLTSSSDDIILFMFAKALPSCSTFYLPELCELCKLVMEKKNCSVFSVASVAAALLCWSITPNTLSSSTVTYCEEFTSHLSNFTYSTKTMNLMENSLYKQLFNSNAELQWATNISILISKWENEGNLIDFLRFLDGKKNILLVDFHPLILAVCLQTKSIVVTKVVLKILDETCKNNKKFAFSTLCLVLYRLSHEFEPQLQLEYLKMVPLMAVDMENVPLILATILSLQGGATNVMLPLRLNLLVSLWKLQPRVFSHLHTLLKMSSSKIIDNWKLQVTRATTLLTICRHNPHTNVKDLVGLLSNVLNESDGHEGSAAACIALDAITELCRCKLIDAQGTWAALKGKMVKENRPLVGGSLCRLLAETSGDSECEESIAMLWKFVENDCAASNALLALGQFPLQHFSLQILPDRFKHGLKVPKELQQAEAGQTLEEVLTYVPGEFWIQVLERIDSKILNSCETMVEDLLKKEVADFPRNIYHVPLGATQAPSSYAHLPPTSLLRAMVAFLRKSLTDNSKERLKISIMKILSKDYLRSFPPQDWTFLRPLFADENLKMSAIRLCALQGPKSASAKQLLQEFLDLINTNDIEVAVQLLKELPSIAQCVVASVVSTLVTDGLQTLLVDNHLFNDAINNIRKTIALAVVPEANRKAAAKGVIALLLTDILPDIEGLDVLWECLAELPDNLIDPIVNPEKWPEITPVRLQQALRVRRASACALSNSPPPCPLDCFVQLIDTVCWRPSDQPAVLEEILIVLNTSSASVGKCSVWFRQLITRLLDAITSPMPFEGCMFLLKIMLMTSAALSGLDALLIHDQLNENNLLHIFPASISALFQHPGWDPHICHIIEGLHRVSKWADLPGEHRAVMRQALITLRAHPYCFQSYRWCRLFYQPITENSPVT